MSFPHSVKSVGSRAKIDLIRLSARHPNDFQVLGERADTIKIGQYAKKNVSLGVHMFAKEHIFTQVVDGKVVIPIKGLDLAQ